MGFSVDDDNDPLPENNPVQGGEVNEEINWGWSGIDYRREQTSNPHAKPSFARFTANTAININSIGMFFLFSKKLH